MDELAISISVACPCAPPKWLVDHDLSIWQSKAVCLFQPAVNKNEPIEAAIPHNDRLHVCFDEVHGIKDC